MHIVNYYLRHNKITLFLVIHNLYSTNLLNEILLAPHLFVAYSNLGYYIVKKLQTRLGGPTILSFWQEPDKYNYHFCYVNCNKNYLINCVDHLFLGKSSTMFANNQTYIIHKKDFYCNHPKIAHETNPPTIENDIKEYLMHSYPKNKNIHLVFKILVTQNLINDTLFFRDFSHIHIADFCSFINNRFYKSIKKQDMPLLKLMKQLQTMNIKLPRIAIKNPVAQKYLT